MISVPALPGVPALKSYGKLTSIYLDVLDIISLFDAAPVWGIFNTIDNLPVAIADTVLDFDFRGDSRISEFPVEAGSFASYNKVHDSDLYRIRMAKSGTVGDKADFLDAIEAVKRSMKLYTIITPDRVYTPCNVESYDYRRAVDDGASIIKVDLTFREIREVTAQYTTTNNSEEVKNPGAAAPAASGKVQPKATPKATASKVPAKKAKQIGAPGSW